MVCLSKRVVRDILGVMVYNSLLKTITARKIEANMRKSQPQLLSSLVESLGSLVESGVIHLHQLYGVKRKREQ